MRASGASTQPATSQPTTVASTQHTRERDEVLKGDLVAHIAGEGRGQRAVEVPGEQPVAEGRRHPVDTPARAT